MPIYPLSLKKSSGSKLPASNAVPIKRAESLPKNDVEKKTQAHRNKGNLNDSNSSNSKETGLQRHSSENSDHSDSNNSSSNVNINTTRANKNRTKERKSYYQFFSENPDLILVLILFILIVIIVLKVEMDKFVVYSITILPTCALSKIYWEQIKVCSEQIFKHIKIFWHGSERAHILADLEWKDFEIKQKERAFRDARNKEELAEELIASMPVKRGNLFKLYEDRRNVAKAATVTAKRELELAKRERDNLMHELSDIDKETQEDDAAALALWGGGKFTTRSLEKAVSKSDSNMTGEELDTLLIHEGPSPGFIERRVDESQMTFFPNDVLCNYCNLGKYYSVSSYVKLPETVGKLALYNVSYRGGDDNCPYSLSWGERIHEDQESIHVLCVGTNNAVTIWDVDGNQRDEFNNGSEEIRFFGRICSLDYSESSRIVMGCDDGYVVSLDGNGWRCIGRHEEESKVKSVKKLNGNQVVSGGEDGTIRIWDVDDNNEFILVKNLIDKSVPNDKAHDGHVNSISYSKKYAMIVSGSSDNLIKIWSYEDGHLIRTIGKVKGSLGLNGHSDAITSLDISFDCARGIPIIVSGSCDSSIKIWNAFNGELLRTCVDPKTMSEKFSSVVLTDPSPSTDGDDSLVSSGQLIISGSSSGIYGYVKVWDALSGTVIHSFVGSHLGKVIPAAHNNPVLSVALSPDCSRVASSGFDLKVKYWSVTDHPVIKDYLEKQNAMRDEVVKFENQRLGASKKAADASKVSTKGRNQRIAL